MAYKTAELHKKALKVIKEHNLIFIEDVVAYLPCSKPTFYAHSLNESDELKELLEQNKIRTKTELREKWYESSNATLQMALYKLLATQQEHRKLAMEYRDHTSRGESITDINITVKHRDE